MAIVIASRFQKKDKFYEKIGEDIYECLANYIDACSDPSASQGQRFNNLHNLFDDEAKRLYQNLIYSKVTQFQHACDLHRNEHSSVTRQNRICKYLESPHNTRII